VGDALTLDDGDAAQPLVAAGGDAFTGANSTARYTFTQEHGTAGLRWATDDADPIELTRVAAVLPPALAMTDYAGDYRSEALGATWSLALREGHLVRSQWMFPAQELRPALADIFTGDLSEGSYVLRFTRDGSGRVEGFDIGTTMVRPIHFSRVAAAEQDFRDELARSLSLGMPGVSVALATRQGVIWTGAAGLANVQTRSPAHAGYLYGIGSITKVFVACVVQQLADEGRLDLDAPVRDVLGAAVTGDIAGADRATIRQLLNHTAGVPTWEFDADWMRRGRGADLLTSRPWRKDEPLEYLRHGRHEATNAPGAAYAYSNSNYTLLGLVIEKVTGHELVQELHERLLTPLGLPDIRLEGFEPVDATRLPARYHADTPQFRRDAGLHPSFRPVAPGLVDVSASNLSTEWAAGGLVATAHDLAAFALALRDGHVVGPAALQRMTRFVPTRDAEDPGSEVGEGLFREQLEEGTLVGEDGGVLGFGAVMGWLEQDDLVIVVMTNVGSMHAGDSAYYPLRLVKSARFLRAARALGAALAPHGAPGR